MMGEERPKWFEILMNEIWEKYQSYTGALIPVDEEIIGKKDAKKALENLHKIIVSFGFEIDDNIKGRDRGSKSYYPTEFYNLHKNGNIQTRDSESEWVTTLGGYTGDQYRIPLKKSSRFIEVKEVEEFRQFNEKDIDWVFEIDELKEDEMK